MVMSLFKYCCLGIRIYVVFFVLPRIFGAKVVNYFELCNYFLYFFNIYLPFVYP